MEMNVALAIHPDLRLADDPDLVPEESFRTTVRELCGLLVSIRDSTIYLIHQTAKEFLVEKDTWATHFSNAKLSRDELA